MRWRAVAAAAVVVVVAALAWSWLRARAERSRRAAIDEALAVGDSEGEPVDGRTGVGARSNDSASRRVLGQVVDEFGEPVDDGRISLRCLVEDEVVAIPRSSVALDDEGRFAAPGCFGVICAELHHPALRPAEPWVLRIGEPTVLQAVGLARLHGEVVDRGGAPIAGARVSLRPGDDADPEGMMPTVSRSTTTDADGQWSIALVERAPCDPCTEVSGGCDDSVLPLHDHVWVVASAEGFAPAQLELELTPGLDREAPALRLGAPADTLSGRLIGADGHTYPRAHVIARPTEAGEDGVVLEQHEADVQGDSFAFESLGAGPYDLRVLQDGVEIATASAVRPGDDVELVGQTPAAGPDVEVRVLLAGVPAPGVRVDGGPFRGAVTDAQGRVRVEQAMPGDYVLRVRRSGSPSVTHPLHVDATHHDDPDPAARGMPSPRPAAMAPGQPGTLRVDIELPA